MVPLLKQARSLQQECRRLSREAIERPPTRPSFHALFKDVQSFLKGPGDPGRLIHLAGGLARTTTPIVDDIVNKSCADQCVNRSDGVGAMNLAVLLQKEATWQETAGAFTARFRSVYGESYIDVVTGICDAVETARVGLRLLASSAAETGRCIPRYCSGERSGVDDGPSLARLQELLLAFPLTSGCFRHQPFVQADELVDILGPVSLDCLDKNNKDLSGVQHMAVLQVMLEKVVRARSLPHLFFTYFIKKIGFSVVTISRCHDAPVVSVFMQMLYVLSKGNVIESGTPPLVWVVGNACG